jgi:4-hydroxy-L-threonine phosphate dehydrogenase PdxA
MKVYVTQGHEKGIGLEVFFKSCLLISRQELRHLKLLAFRKSVQKTLSTLGLPFTLKDDSIHLAGVSIDVIWINEANFSESFTALELGMKLSESSGVLFTLPTSKDQFPGYPGHTEYFRASYHRSDLGMFFSSPSLQVLLLTDHVPVKELSALLTEELISERLSTALKTFKQWQWPFNRVLISGFNPHAGESGLIGNEDDRIKKVIKRLSSSLKIDMAGPFPGDTMLLEKKSPKDLLVYLFHDQGLGVFKGLQGFIGSNITLGLPFPRFSPDHGTSFRLFGKNQSDYRGCEFALKEAVNMLKKVSNGKNSSHKSQST